MISTVSRRILAFVITLALAAVTPFPTHAEATTTTDRVIVPFEILLDACNFEEVILSGELLIITRTTFDDLGGLHAGFTQVLRDVRGVGAVTGTVYKGAGVYSFSFSSTADFPPINSTIAQSFNLISQGGTDNRVVELIVHGTVNAQGEATADISRFSSRCVG